MALSIKKVLISEPVDECCERILRENGVHVVTKTGMKKEELLQEIQTYDGLVVRSATKVTADVIAAGKELHVIGRAGTGVDNIDCDAATRQGILVLNAPGGNTLSAAELTCAMIVSLSRNLAEACASLKSGKWDRKSFMGNELFGKTLAILGLGRIGREVASRMQAFGMKTVGYDPLVPPEVSAQFGVEGLELEQIWPIADYITVHVPLIPQTKNLIGDETFSKCKKGVKIINCARGGVVDEDALVRALESGQCGGAGLDVYLEEPPKNRALVEHRKVICTPHLGASTVEAQKRVAEEIAVQFVDLIHGRLVPGIVNSPAFCNSMKEENVVWADLCQFLGAILGCLLGDAKGAFTLSISLPSQELKAKQDVMRTATLVGLLKQLKHNDANFINAPVLAKDANIEVSTSAFQEPGDSSLPLSVMLSVSNQNFCHSVVGTVSGNVPALTAIDGAGFEDPAKLRSRLVLCRGKHGAAMTATLLGSLDKVGTIHSAHWSTVFEGRSWCIVNGNFTADKKPQELGDLVDFWGQLAV